MPQLNAREAANILKRNGFTLVSQKGSHQKWKNLQTKKQVIVPYHKGKQLPEGTIRSIIKGSGIPAEKWK